MLAKDKEDPQWEQRPRHRPGSPPLPSPGNLRPRYRPVYLVERRPSSTQRLATGATPPLSVQSAALVVGRCSSV
jgi:hypothetical protein